MLQALRDQENQRQSARKMRYLRGKVHTASTTMVTYTDSTGNRIDITDQKEMEKATLENNRQKFTQSAHTPFYLSPLKDGFKGLTSAAQTVLAGIYESYHELDERILDVITQWQML
jgi:hypothetical protein